MPARSRQSVTTLKRAFLLNLELDQTVLDIYLVTFNRTSFFRKTFAGANIEAPGVEVAFDDISVEARIGERVGFVRAEIFDGVESSADIK